MQCACMCGALMVAPCPAANRRNECAHGCAMYCVSEPLGARGPIALLTDRLRAVLRGIAEARRDEQASVNL